MTGNSNAWGLPKVLSFFDNHRDTTTEVYPSEWFFLKDCLHEGISVLDVGCAQGGFCNVLAEHLQTFSYTGIDINPSMIDRARLRHPGHEFLCLPEADFSALGERSFDLVLVLGILHLHESWRQTLAGAWTHCGQVLLCDLRETSGPTIEDKGASCFAMDFNGDDGDSHAHSLLPYVILNTSDALNAVESLCPNGGVSRFGYTHTVSPAARTPVREVMTTTYQIRRREMTAP